MNKIIALWTHPRAVSTAFERVMMERGDFKVLHEPFSYLFYVHNQIQADNDLIIDPTHPTSYADIKKFIFKIAKTTPVFFKDMAYHCFKELSQDEDFLSNLTNTFLIRNPAKSIPSAYALKPKISLEEIGYEQLFYLFQKVSDLTDVLPLVIDADDLQNNSTDVVASYCKAINITFNPNALQWQKSRPKEWKSWQRWHSDAAQSTTIHKKRKIYKDTVENNTLLKSYYDYQLPFYKQLYQHRLVS